jgi:hypothetical protein
VTQDRGRSGRAGLEDDPEREHPKGAGEASSAGDVQRGQRDAKAVLQNADAGHGNPREREHPRTGAADQILGALAHAVRAAAVVAHLGDGGWGIGDRHDALLIAYSMPVH